MMSCTRWPGAKRSPRTQHVDHMLICTTVKLLKCHSKVTNSFAKISEECMNFLIHDISWHALFTLYYSIIKWSYLLKSLLYIGISNYFPLKIKSNQSNQITFKIFLSTNLTLKNRSKFFSLKKHNNRIFLWSVFIVLWQSSYTWWL